MTGVIVLTLLVFMVAAAVPVWPHSATWGYVPSGALGLIVVAFAVLLFTGRF
jgi:hypothetical protein